MQQMNVPIKDAIRESAIKENVCTNANALSAVMFLVTLNPA
jgi:hypothetical protein